MADCERSATGQFSVPGKVRIYRNKCLGTHELGMARAVTRTMLIESQPFGASIPMGGDPHPADAELTTMFNSMGEGVVCVDGSGIVIRINPAGERLTGWTMAEAKGVSIREVFRLIDGNSREPVENPFDHARRKNETVFLPKNTFLVRRNGSELPIADSCAPLRTSEATFAGAVVVFRDLTAQREAEANEASAKTQMVFMERMAALGALAAGVAHEINNPLCYMLGNVEMAIEKLHALNAEKGPELANIEEMLSEASGGIARVARIVSGLKSLSRPESENTRSIDLLPVLETSINGAMNEIRHRARLLKSYGAVPPVLADDVRLGQVFLNLLINAAQALSPGNDSNQISVTTSTDPRGHALIEIADNGPGIPPLLLQRIFEPFFTTKAAAGGTGLGLSVSNSIVAALGGEISVNSIVGIGTAFRVTLPPSAEVVRKSTPAGPQPSSAPMRCGAVLIVDDEAAIGRVIRRSLHMHDVTVVNSAQAALALLATGKMFDLVLTDLMMPEMSGMELYKEILVAHPGLAAKVAFMTGGAFTPEARKFLESVGNERLAKPFSPWQLGDVVRKFIV